LASADHSLTAALTLPARLRGTQRAALALAHSGDSPVWGVLVVAAWFLGDHGWKVRALVYAIGLVVVEVAVIALKMVFRRHRPPGELGRIYRRADPYSFPSGHAARAVLLCILAWQLGPVAALVAIAIWSPLMVLARIAVGIHYVFDVVAGIILGCGLTAALLVFVPVVARWV
jgi:membrane-associated phospholipid phosphatase